MTVVVPQYEVVLVGQAGAATDVVLKDVVPELDPWPDAVDELAMSTTLDTEPGVIVAFAADETVPDEDTPEPEEILKQEVIVDPAA